MLSAGAAEKTSESVFLFTDPDTSSFWRTAPGRTVTVPVEFPDGVTTATLTVKGSGYSHEYVITRDADTPLKDFAFELPAATSPETEDVYTLTLTVGTTEQTAKIALIEGLSPETDGTTRCLAPMTEKRWQKTKGRAVLPIPYGTTSFRVNDVERPTGLDGAQGLYALDGLTYGNDATLKLTVGDVEYDATLLGGPGGLLLLFR